MVLRPATESDYPGVARIQALSPEAAQWPLGDYSNFRVVLALIPHTLRSESQLGASVAGESACPTVNLKSHVGQALSPATELNSAMPACASDRIAGFCAWRQTATDEAELLNLAVDPRLRKQGVAKGLLAELRRLASGDIFLEVEEGNFAACSLYRRTGWIAVSTRKDYYGPGRNAIVMKNSSC